jgi:uncharacterized protein YdhG (YjbR/CyaY superfamily)
MISMEVDEYLADLDPDRKEALGRIRSMMLETIPGVVEAMKYRMPTYELKDVVSAMASQKYYMSLYMNPILVEKYKSELENLNIGKSCIRFKKVNDLPINVME